MLRTTLVVLVGLVGCSSSMVYRPPVLTGENDGSTRIELPFDEVWEELIDMLSTSFLSIEFNSSAKPVPFRGEPTTPSGGEGMRAYTRPAGERFSAWQSRGFALT